jgi:uncharacterized membrane-anchored protein
MCSVSGYFRGWKVNAPLLVAAAVALLVIAAVIVLVRTGHHPPQIHNHGKPG